MMMKEIIPNAEVEAIPCPNCGKLGLKLHEKLVADPLGSSSLPGMQLKFTAKLHIWIECDECEAKGEVSRA